MATPQPPGRPARRSPRRPPCRAGAVRDAIRALERRRAKEALKLDRLRLSIRQGVAALDRGDYAEVGDEDLDSQLDDLAALAHR